MTAIILILLCAVAFLMVSASWRRRAGGPAASAPVPAPVLRSTIAALIALMAILLAILLAPRHAPLMPADWIFIAVGALLGVTGLYIIAEPKRLFIRAEDPSSYRPETVDYDSPQGVWLRKTYGPALIVIALVFILTRIL